MSQYSKATALNLEMSQYRKAEPKAEPEPEPDTDSNPDYLPSYEPEELAEPKVEPNSDWQRAAELAQMLRAADRYNSVKQQLQRMTGLHKVRCIANADLLHQYQCLNCGANIEAPENRCDDQCNDCAEMLRLFVTYRQLERM